MLALKYITTVSRHVASSCNHRRAEVGRPRELGHHEYVMIFGGQQHFFRKLTSHFVEFRCQGDTYARAEIYHDCLQACGKLV